MLEFPADFGRYKLVGVAGEGGMATVYRAVLPGPMGFEKRLVVKVIRPSLVEDEEFLRALVTEALLGCQLHHPNIVEIYEFNQHKGRYYLAMELVDGVSLSYMVKRHRKVGYTIPTPVIMLLLEQIVEGLHYAHNARNEDGSLLDVIHRDLKPSNIAITPEGRLKILDFGIARASLDRSGMETSGAIRGTPRYMSPEQIETPLNVTPASDLFSVGSVLYELVTLRPLFAPQPGRDPTDLVIHMPLDERIEEVKNRHAGLGRVFERLIARPLGLRYGTAEAVARDMTVLLEQHADPARAKIYLTELVDEYKAESQEEEIPSFFSPGYAEGWEPGEEASERQSSPSLLTATELLPDADDPEATIPLPPRPHQLITGKHQRIGPQSAPSNPSTGHSTGTGAGYESVTGNVGRPVVRQQQPVSQAATTASFGTMSVGTGGTTGGISATQEGGNWGIVAALAVPLVVLVVVGLVMGLGVFLSGQGRSGASDAARGPVPGHTAVDDGSASEPLVERATPAEVGTPAEVRERSATPTDGGSIRAKAEEAAKGVEKAAVKEEVTPAVKEATPAESTPEPEPEPVKAKPKPKPKAKGTGTIRVDSDPWGSVTLDKKSKGETPVTLTVPVGTHTVTLRCMGSGQPVTKQIEVAKGATEKWFLPFQPDLCPE